MRADGPHGEDKWDGDGRARGRAGLAAWRSTANVTTTHTGNITSKFLIEVRMIGDGLERASLCRSLALSRENAILKKSSKNNNIGMVVSGRHEEDNDAMTMDGFVMGQRRG